MKSVLLSLLLTFMLVGCNSAKTCKQHGYKGVVFSTHDPMPSMHCSDGEITTSGKHWKTKNGLQPKRYVFVEYEDMKTIKKIKKQGK